ncbi:MAG: glycine cleavage system aminomethyltransferase GcvT [Raoultibacter sp.]
MSETVVDACAGAQEDAPDAQKTPLYEAHLESGGKMVPFAGYLLPIEYPTGLMAEHLAVRNSCGLFDVSHMGEIKFLGAGALDTLNHLLTNDFTDLAVGKVRYSPMCDENGGTIDDLLVYHLGEDHYLTVVNAANKEKDKAWMEAHLLPDTKLQDISDDLALLSLQGPAAERILERICDPNDIPRGYYSFTPTMDVADIPCFVSRTGYTGEDGFELFCYSYDGWDLWDCLLEAGAEDGLIPCGLGARDTLRLEASMPLYGHEMDASIDPLEAGLAFGVKMGKADFIGKQALAAKGTPARCRIGLQATSRGIIREHQDVFVGDTLIGSTTSGTYCPHLKGSYAMALVDAGAVSIGDAVEVDVRGRRVCADVVALPFYKLA